MTKKMRLLPLVGATFFMVAGGPYGLEDIIGKAGYGRALLLLLLIPLVWSLPTSLMVGELASAIPAEGGFYAWVSRGLGEFWGFQEAWLSLAASVFDMAIYPVVFVLYLSQLEPNWTAGTKGMLWKLAVVAACTIWNLRGAKAVGDGSVGLGCVLMSPFVVMIGLGVWRGVSHGGGLAALSLHAGTAERDMAGAVSVCLWNYMGWDNASTVAQEVEDPARTYPRAMLLAAGLVALTYALPLAAVALAGMPAEAFSTGAWVAAAKVLGSGWGLGWLGGVLALAVVAGGMMNGAGMFNSLMMSYTRLPFALAEDGFLPAVLKRRTRGGVPWVSVLFCAGAWALALGMTFERLISIDLVLYGASLVLEFVALVALRVKEPELVRPFRVPGGIVGAVAAGVGPTVLIGYALWAARDERVLGMPALGFAAGVGVAGWVVYGVALGLRRRVAA